ncbi:MAG: hypothetical protein AAGF12_22305, partial [Myxococcota bacterium]
GRDRADLGTDGELRCAHTRTGAVRVPSVALDELRDASGVEPYGTALCVLTEAGEVWCQRRESTRDPWQEFLQVDSFSGARSLLSGRGRNCAFFADDSFECAIDEPGGYDGLPARWNGEAGVAPFRGTIPYAMCVARSTGEVDCRGIHRNGLLRVPTPARIRLDPR